MRRLVDAEAIMKAGIGHLLMIMGRTGPGKRRVSVAP
jgi:hypothetical protein